MLYKLLGMVVWKVGKWFLRGRYGAAMAPKPLLAGGALLLLIAGAVLAVARARNGSD
jgi:hypothetical protein